MKSFIFIVLLISVQSVAQTTVILRTDNLYTIELCRAVQVDDIVHMYPMELPELIDINDSTSQLIVPNNEFLYFKLKNFDMNVELVGLQTNKTTTVKLPIDFTDKLSPEMIYNESTNKYEVFYYEMTKL
jgi:hypothetical protein